MANNSDIKCWLNAFLVSLKLNYMSGILDKKGPKLNYTVSCNNLSETGIERCMKDVQVSYSSLYVASYKNEILWMRQTLFGQWCSLARRRYSDLHVISFSK